MLVFCRLGSKSAFSILRIGGFGRCPNPSTFHTPDRYQQFGILKLVDKWCRNWIQPTDLHGHHSAIANSSNT